MKVQGTVRTHVALIALAALLLSAGSASGQLQSSAERTLDAARQAAAQQAEAIAEAQAALRGEQAQAEEQADTGEGSGTVAQTDGIELHVKDADLSAVLKLLADQQQLNIVAGKDVSGKVTADLYGVTLDEALYAVLEMNGYAYRREGKFIYVYTKEQLEQVLAAEAKTLTRVFVLSYVNVDEARELIKPVLSKTAVVASTTRAASGIPSGGDDVDGDTYAQEDKLVITDYEENLAHVAALLKEIDVRPKQVLVEATILQVTLDDESSLGVDFNILAGIDFHDLSTANVSPVEPGAIVGAAGVTVPSTMAPFASAGTQGFATPGQGLNIGILTNEVSFFIQALEAVEDVNVLSNPKVLALNKQRAEVLVGERLGYRTTTTTTTSEVEDIQFLDTGTQLQFRPFIAADGFIRMEIHPEVSSGQIDVLGLPSEQTTELTCNIMVRDGHTIVIGGLFDETSQITKAQVPLLGDIPVLGGLFRNDSHETMRREIIVLLTPHIIDDAVAAVEGAETLSYAENTVQGLRSRFPCYTREGLTQIHLHEAELAHNRFVATGNDADRQLALWHYKLARHVAPNNTEAHAKIKQLDETPDAARPRLEAESVLWRRMKEHGLLENVNPTCGRGAVKAKPHRD